jgi:hypothetical protein
MKSSPGLLQLDIQECLDVGCNESSVKSGCFLIPFSLLCFQDLNPAKLRHLHKLGFLSELSLGCHHRLIASSVTDHCLAELVALTQLRSLNLSQCVHVGDAGGWLCWALGQQRMHCTTKAHNSSISPSGSAHQRRPRSVIHITCWKIMGLGERLAEDSKQQTEQELCLYDAGLPFTRESVIHGIAAMHVILCSAVDV